MTYIGTLWPWTMNLSFRSWSTQLMTCNMRLAKLPMTSCSLIPTNATTELSGYCRAQCGMKWFALLMSGDSWALTTQGKKGLAASVALCGSVLSDSIHMRLDMETIAHAPLELGLKRKSPPLPTLLLKPYEPQSAPDQRGYEMICPADVWWQLSSHHTRQKGLSC